MEDIRNFISDNVKPAYWQLALGTACGFVSGKLFRKVSKLAAIGLAGGVLAIYALNRQGIVTVDQEKMSNAVQKVKDKVQEKVQGRNLPQMDDVAQHVGDELKFVVVGFAGGFVIGML